MNNNVNKSAVFSFLDGNYTSIQRKSIEEWLRDPANEEVFYQYLNEYESQHPQYSVRVEERLQALKYNLHEFVSEINTTKEASPWWQNRVFRISSAAAVLILSLLTFIYNGRFKAAESPITENYYKTGSLLKENMGDTPITFILPDKSSVVLQPKAKLSYIENGFGQESREVYFEGEGFFEVQKDASSPFIVYTRDYATKVLGTSFTLKTSNDLTENEVIVKTGKVAVFKGQNESLKNKKDVKPNVLLSANQRIRFDKAAKQQFVPTSTGRNDKVERIEKMTFEFDDKPVTEVFSTLEEVYHIRIVYDHEFMKDCRITAFLADEPLYEKIRLLSFALNARFEFINESIVITSRGC